ncbi:MAG: cell division protein FtsQ/DivIB [Spirochaetota bacterium]
MIEESRKYTLRTKKVVRLALTTLICVLIVLVVMRVWSGRGSMSIFPIKQVQIFGNNSLTKGEIAGMIGLETGDSLLFFSRKHAMEQMRRDARIRNVEIVKIYPDILRIFLTEKERVAVLGYGGKYYLLSIDAVVLSVMEELSLVDVPFITLSRENDDIKIGNRVDNPMLLNLLGEIQVFRRDYPEFFRFIDYFSIDESGISVYLEDTSYRVYLGCNLTGDKLKRLRALFIVLQTIHSNKALERRMFEVDMSFSYAAVREGDLRNEL